MQDTSINTLIVNKLTQAQYNSATKDPEQWYFVTDAKMEISEVDGLQALLDTKANINDVLPSTTKYGADLSASVNQNTSQLSISLLDQDGNQLGSTQTVTLPDVDIDNTTITTNQSGEIQAEATLDHNPNASGPVYDWVGTLSEFTTQNIASLHPEWLCFITDDGGSVSGIYTAAQCDALFARIADVYSRSQANTLLSAKADAADVYMKAEVDTVTNSKANIDADNFSALGKAALTTIGYPDVTRAESVTPLASGSEYTAPENGWFFTISAVSAANAYTYIRYSANTDDLFRYLEWKTTTGGGVNVWCPVKAGEKVLIVYSNVTLSKVYFIPAYGQQ